MDSDKNQILKQKYMLQKIILKNNNIIKLK